MDASSKINEDSYARRAKTSKKAEDCGSWT